MAYATEAQAIALYDTAYIQTACSDGAGGIDSDRLAQNLELASQEIDMHLFGRVDLPLATPPAILQRYCVDIALKSCAPTADLCTDGIKERHDHAMMRLKMISEGKIRLETSTDAAAADNSRTAEIVTKETALVTSDARQFRRDDLKRLL